VIVTQCSTFSKHPNQNCAGFPKEIYSGYGAKVISSGGHSYIDWTWSGTGILGHAPPDVCKAVSETIFKGIAFGLPHVLEKQTAELICEMLPDYAESVRFALNGTDAVAGAVRLARAVTGCKEIVTFPPCYHGDSADWAIDGKAPGRGVISDDLNYASRWNDQGFFEVPAAPAAVIFEIREPPTPEFVNALNS